MCPRFVYLSMRYNFMLFFIILKVYNISKRIDGITGNNYDTVETEVYALRGLEDD